MPLALYIEYFPGTPSLSSSAVEATSKPKRESMALPLLSGRGSLSSREGSVSQARKLEFEKGKLRSTVSCFQNEVRFLTYQLDNMTKSIRMLNNGSDMLDAILLVGKRSTNFTGVGFNSQSLNKQG